jgi:hypothetical protein
MNGITFNLFIKQCVNSLVNKPKPVREFLGGMYSNDLENKVVDSFGIFFFSTKTIMK